MWIWKVLRAWLNKFFSQKAKIFQRVKFLFLFSLSLHDICIFPPLNLFISLSPRLRLWGKLNINQKGKKEKSTYRLLNYQHHNGCHGKDETQSQRDCGKIEVTAARGPQVAGNGASWHMHGCVLSRGHLVECSLQPCVHSYIVFPASHLISPHLIRFWAHLGSKKDSPLHPGTCEYSVQQMKTMEILLGSGILGLESWLLVVWTEWVNLCVSWFYHLYDEVNIYLTVLLL